MLQSFTQLSEILNSCQNDENLVESYLVSLEIFRSSVYTRSTIFIVGNGGSAAQAQHFAAELVGRFKLERPAYPAVALTTDTSALTAIGNDYGFDVIFSRQIEALGKPNDVLVILSTSGNSTNCIKALETAKKLKMKTIALLGKDGGKIKKDTDISIIVQNNDTARIQEIHLHIIHEWCQHIDKLIVESNK